MAVLAPPMPNGFQDPHIGTNMTWYAVTISSSNATTTGDVKAVVQQFASLAAFKSATGTTPSQMGVPGETDAGFKTQLQAQAAANAFNALPVNQRSAGGKPLAPNLLTPILKNPLSNVLGGFNLGSWFLRVGEILLGLVLIGVGVARITGVQNAISKVVKAKVPI